MCPRLMAGSCHDSACSSMSHCTRNVVQTDRKTREGQPCTLANNHGPGCPSCELFLAVVCMTCIPVLCGTPVSTCSLLQMSAVRILHAVAVCVRTSHLYPAALPTVSITVLAGTEQVSHVVIHKTCMHVCCWLDSCQH